MKIWIFGDSFSCGFDSTSKYNWIKDYVNHIGYSPKNYGELLSDVLNCDVINLSKSGDSNYDIFHSFINEVTNINKKDIVIIQFTSVYRYRLVDKNDEFSGISGGWDYLFKHFNESSVTIQEIGIFAGSSATATKDSGILVSRILWAYSKTGSEELNFTRSDRLIL